MGFKCGIIGLPNVGKSTLFNALTETAAAEAANYPFCTIEPNTGEVPVRDPRLDEIARIARSARVVPARMTFVDIAGLVKGASKGEGLGNQFLGNIREVDAIVHVLRCFEDADVAHVEGRIDPLCDAEIVETELMLADLESLERQRAALEKKAKATDKTGKEARARLALIDRVREGLEEGRPARLAEISPEERAAFRALHLLSAKPVLYVANVEEAAAARGNRYAALVAAYAREQGASSIIVSARIEAELAALDEGERREYLEELGLAEPGLDRLVRAGYALLGLITFFTAGPKEARAWTIPKGTTAARAAGTIHTDFEKGFIRAETISYEDYVRYGGEAGAKEAGRMRLEGRDYVVEDGDVMLVRFAV